VIVAHQLLKNDIPQHEYWLITDSLRTNQEFPQSPRWMKWNKSWKELDAVRYPFYYTQLSELKANIPPGHYPPLDLSGKRKLISLSRKYDTDLITLFHACGDFQYRSQWQEGVKSVEEISHILPRIGTKCKMVLSSGDSIVYSNSYSYSPDRIEFSETYEDSDTLKHFLLEKRDDGAQLTLDYYVKKNLRSLFTFSANRKLAKEMELRKSLERLENVIDSLK